jgi:hypothetical protein
MRTIIYLTLFFLFSANAYAERFYSKSQLPDCLENTIKNNCYGIDRIGNDIYEGEFQNNQRSGLGLYKHSNGQLAVGGWVNDHINGIGTYVYKGNINEFLDLLKLSARNNYNVDQTLKLLATFKGEWYMGEMQNEKRNGKGVYITNGTPTHFMQSTVPNNASQGNDDFALRLQRFGEAMQKLEPPKPKATCYSNKDFHGDGYTSYCY